MGRYAHIENGKVVNTIVAEEHATVMRPGPKVQKQDDDGNVALDENDEPIMIDGPMIPTPEPNPIFKQLKLVEAGKARIGDLWDGASFAAPPAQEPTEAQINAAVRTHLNAAAKERGYDDILSAVSYVGSATYGAEAEAFRDWRDAVWAKAFQIASDAKNGVRPAPQIAALLAELPVFGA